MAGDEPIERFHAAQQAWETLRDPVARKAHQRSLQRANPAQPTATVTRRPSVDPSTADAMESLTFEVRLPQETIDEGGPIAARVPINTACPGCGGHIIARKDCAVCAGGGRLQLNVRASLLIPRAIELEARVMVPCDLELFGQFQVGVRVTRA